MKKIKIKNLEKVYKRSISSIIVVILIILITVILTSIILVWSKNSIRTNLDVTTENMDVLSELECSNLNYEIDFCDINIITKHIDFLITNNSRIKFSNFTLSVHGKNMYGDPMSVLGLFSTSIASGSSKLFSMDSNYYSIIKQNLDISLLDLNQEYSFNLVSETCPNSVINLSCTFISN